MVFMVGLMANLLGTYVLPTPIAEWITQNRGMCILLVLASNFMAGQLLATGAFEVSYNGVPVFSKINTGYLVGFPELKRMIDQVRDAQA
jgi:selT/selW/selH-like putative selenoprotein